MFYPNLMHIGTNELVLEIGPGAFPHWRSDCLVDKFDESDSVDLGQFGGLPQNTQGKPLSLSKMDYFLLRTKALIISSAHMYLSMLT